MNQKGVVPLALVLIVASVLALGAFSVYKYQTGSERRLSSTQKQLLKTVKGELKDIQVTLEEIESPKTIEEINQAKIEQLRNQVQERANTILSKNLCNVDMDDIREALQTAQQARLLGMDVFEQLIGWVEDGVRSIVADEAPSPGETWGSEHDQLYYAQLARLLGLEDLYQDILNGDVNLGDWKKENCQEGYTAIFSSAILTGSQGAVTGSWTIQNAKAQTCKGLYSSWSGSYDTTMTLTTGAGSDSQNLGTKPFGFALQEGDSRLDSSKKNITITIPVNCYFCDQNQITLSGIISKGASGCKN
jgi:hypothetical protein